MKGPPRSRWRNSPVPSTSTGGSTGRTFWGPWPTPGCWPSRASSACLKRRPLSRGWLRFRKRSTPVNLPLTRLWKTSTWPWRPASPPRSARWGASCTPPGAETIRWPWMCACTWPMRWKPSSGACRSCGGPGRGWPDDTSGSSCRATPTCSGPNPCYSPTTCWPTTRCGAGTGCASPNPWPASGSRLWGPRPWPAPPSPSIRSTPPTRWGSRRSSATAWTR